MKLRIKDEHLEYLKKECLEVLGKYPDIIKEYESGNFNKAKQTKDLQKRFCFDICHAAGLNQFIVVNLYQYMDDNHLYSALKSFLPKIEKRY